MTNNGSGEGLSREGGQVKVSKGVGPPSQAGQMGWLTR